MIYSPEFAVNTTLEPIKTLAEIKWSKKEVTVRIQRNVYSSEVIPPPTGQENHNLNELVAALMIN